MDPKAAVSAILRKAWQVVDTAALTLKNAEVASGFNQKALEDRRIAAAEAWKVAVRNWRAANDLYRTFA